MVWFNQVRIHLFTIFFKSQINKFMQILPISLQKVLYSTRVNIRSRSPELLPKLK